MSFDPTGQRVRQKAHIDAQDPSFAASGAFFIEFDVSENETHKSTSKVTDHPVETGATISDNITVDPDTLDLVARVSNTPIAGSNELATLSPARAEESYATFQRIKAQKIVVSVLTTLRAYDNMVVIGTSVQRNAASGQVLAVTVSLREVKTATNQVIPKPTPKIVRAVASTDFGSEQSTTADATTDAKGATIALKLLRAANQDSNIARLLQ